MKHLLTFSFILISIHSYAQSDVGYGKTNEYGRLTINLAYFKKIISSIEYYTKESERELDSVQTSVQCNFKKNKQALYVESFERLAALEIGDDTYDDIQFKYKCKNNN